MSEAQHPVQIRLRQLLAQLLRTQPERVDPAASFLESGADSIVLTEAIVRIAELTGIRVTVRDLFERYTSLELLARHVADRMTPQQVAAMDQPAPVARRQQAVARPEASVVPSLSSGKTAYMKDVFCQQVQLMERQLQLLSRYAGEPLEQEPQPASQAKRETPKADQSGGFWTRSQWKPAPAPQTVVPEAAGADKVDLGLYFFGNYEHGFSEDRYDLIFESVRFADTHNFSSVWLPERHFHAFGGFSPNPAMLASALARETQQIQLRAGSVVLPLHHPVRVVEEWSVVDNLSGGDRVGLAVASGWHPNDFVLAPQEFGNHRQLMFDRIETVQKLWRGELVAFKDGNSKDFQVRVHPKPRTTEIPLWLTIVNNPETYEAAGHMGLGVLTNLMGQSVDDLAGNLEIYRRARAQAGHEPDGGRVTVLLHAFVHEDGDQARSKARGPFGNYLKTSIGLFRNLLRSQGMNMAIEDLSEEDLDYLLDKVFDRYAATSAFFGSPEECEAVGRSLAALGVDEIASFIDFGIDEEDVLTGLPHLNDLRRRLAQPLRREVTV